MSGAETAQYVLDLAATLPVVVSDTGAVYLYGLDIIPQQQVLRQGSGQAPRLYYVHDGLGSVRDLVDSTRDVQANYAYDPFGVPVVEGEVYNPYQYTGEAWDAEVELLYLRARYYQPGVGRFVTRDPWAGNAWGPSSLNPFLYARNNPVNLVDPTGNQGKEPTWKSDGTQVMEPTPPLPYSVSALELGWLWLREQCPEYMVFDEKYHLTQQLKHDQGVNQARTEFHRRLGEGTLNAGTFVTYGYSYVPVNYAREAAEYLVGYDQVGFFLGSYVVHILLNPDGASATFSVLDPKDWESGSRSPCYYAPDFLGPLANPYLPENLRVARSTHSLEGLLMGSEQVDFPSDIFLASVFRPRRRGDPGAFGTGIATGGRMWLKFTWSEPVAALDERTPL